MRRGGERAPGPATQRSRAAPAVPCEEAGHHDPPVARHRLLVAKPDGESKREVSEKGSRPGTGRQNRGNPTETLDSREVAGVEVEVENGSSSEQNLPVLHPGLTAPVGLRRSVCDFQR